MSLGGTPLQNQVAQEKGKVGGGPVGRDTSLSGTDFNEVTSWTGCSTLVHQSCRWQTQAALSHQLRGWHRCKKARDDKLRVTGLLMPGGANVSSNSEPLRIQEGHKGFTV